MKYLIMTLGTGQGVENGLAKSIKAVNPDRVVFLVTGESASNDRSHFRAAARYGDQV